MFSIKKYFAPLVPLVSVWTMSGILLHDVQIDTATLTALSSEKTRLESDAATNTPRPHTHPEGPQLRNKNTQPRIQPKRDTYKSNTSDRKLKKDNYSIKPPSSQKSQS